ncbi:hypothetical protein NQZ68_033591 [Dissostichus eleginoides]|nr:hypothetical protein NQZ68_033591 [Dissostichus eleginoides]
MDPAKEKRLETRTSEIEVFQHFLYQASKLTGNSPPLTPLPQHHLAPFILHTSPCSQLLSSPSPALKGIPNTEQAGETHTECISGRGGGFHRLMDDPSELICTEAQLRIPSAHAQSALPATSYT